MQLLNNKVNLKNTVCTSGNILCKKGFFSQENVKGTKLDHKMQARCFQLILFNIFVHWYFIPLYGPQKYEKMCVDFYKDKIKTG